MTRVERSITETDEDEDVGYKAWLDFDGVVMHHDETLNVDHAEQLVRTLVTELDLPGAHVMEYAHVCSAPRPGEFGGGAFVVQRGLPTVWVDAKHEAMRRVTLKEIRLTRHDLVSDNLPFFAVTARDFSVDLSPYALALFEDDGKVKVVKNRYA
jgi:hypothetical protein